VLHQYGGVDDGLTTLGLESGGWKFDLLDVDSGSLFRKTHDILESVGASAHFVG